MDAREEAAVDEVPGEECSAKIVVRWATQALIWFRWMVSTVQAARCQDR